MNAENVCVICNSISLQRFIIFLSVKLFLIRTLIPATVYNIRRCMLLEIDGGSSDTFSASLLRRPPCWLIRRPSRDQYVRSKFACVALNTVTSSHESLRWDYSVAYEARELDVGVTRDLIIAQPPGTP